MMMVMEMRTTVVRMTLKKDVVWGTLLGKKVTRKTVIGNMMRNVLMSETVLLDVFSFECTPVIFVCTVHTRVSSTYFL